MAAGRLDTLDVLRGAALFGVFLVNFVMFAGSDVMATETQLLSLPSAGGDFALRAVLYWLALDKANTLFALVFGLGFYLQMTRLEARGADAERLYRRRLAILLPFGALHTVFLWNWDILHLYALAGFVLLPLRRLSNRALVVAGLLLAAFGRTAIKVQQEFAAASGAMSASYSEEGALQRQVLSEQGDYTGLVRHFLDLTIIDYIASGFMFGWLLYALGRFLIGAWVGRREWIQNASAYLPHWRRALRWALPAGLILEGGAMLLLEGSLVEDWPHQELIARAAHLIAVPVLAAGYVAAIVVGLQAGITRRVLLWLAPAGRMALTNYLTQSLVYGFVLFGVGPGLALAGRIGTSAVFAIVVAVFAAQVLFSRWWLGHFAYGPVEWLWRALTYSQMPQMRHTASNP